MTYEGATAMDGDLPVNMSGGVLSSNPIGASGHAALCRGRQPGARARRATTRSRAARRSALGHAYGGGSQYFSMCLLGKEKP